MSGAPLLALLHDRLGVDDVSIVMSPDGLGLDAAGYGPAVVRLSRRPCGTSASRCTWWSSPSSPTVDPARSVWAATGYGAQRDDLVARILRGDFRHGPHH